MCISHMNICILVYHMYIYIYACVCVSFCISCLDPPSARQPHPCGVLAPFLGSLQLKVTLTPGSLGRRASINPLKN